MHVNTRELFEDVLAFWFGSGPVGPDEYRQRRSIWFAGSTSVDEQITRRFGTYVKRAGLGEYDAEANADDPRGALALILLLDQFPRHIWRGHARAYAFDDRALARCRQALARGFDQQLDPVERSFLYLPLQHSEDAEDQQDCVDRFETLVEQTPVGDWFHPHALHGRKMARIHSSIIKRYGRFPHRNGVLDRPCTLAERMYLDAGGSSFGQGSQADRPIASADANRRFVVYRPSLDPEQTLCVDGRVGSLRCLSHWPGPAVPVPLRHDLSTGMALRWARLSVTERERLLGQFSIVTNDHYDTDGVLGAHALLRPQQALAHAELMVRAAATGDFRTWNGEQALAVDLTLGALWASPESPIAEDLAAAPDYLAKAQHCYDYALAHIDEILSDPFAYRDLWEDRFERIMDDLDKVHSGRVSVDTHPNADLAVVYAREPLTRTGLVYAAGAHYRVLLVMPGRRGTHYRFLYRNESWFLGIRDRVGPRVPLDAVVRALDRLEGARTARWWCSELDQTAPQLGFGDPEGAANVFGDLNPQLDPTSTLPPAMVVEQLRTVLREPALLSRSA